MSTQKDGKPPAGDEEPQSFFYGGSFLAEMKLIFLAAGAFVFFQFGMEWLDRLEKWIDKDLYPTVAEDTEEYRYLADAGVIDGGVMTAAGFQLDIDRDWAIERTGISMRPDRFMRYLLNPSLETGMRDNPFLLSDPESYIIEMPDAVSKKYNLGQIYMLKKSVFFKHDVAGARGDGFDLDMVSKDDLFDQYFVDQLSMMFSLRKTEGELKINRLRLTTAGAYKIAEIDYKTKSGDRFSAVFYWHSTADMQAVGDLALFMTLVKHPGSTKKQQKMIKNTFSSLRIMEGKREIWSDLDFDTDEGAQITSFLHVQVDALRLKALNLTVSWLEKILHARLPVKAEEVSDMVIAQHGDSKLYLRDVAKLQSYTLDDEGVLATPDSIIFTVLH